MSKPVSWGADYDANLAAVFSNKLSIPRYSRSQRSSRKPLPYRIEVPSSTLTQQTLWRKTNEQFSHRIPLLSDLPNALKSATSLNPEIITHIIDYLGFDYLPLKSIYSIAPELIDPTVPLRISLEITASSGKSGSKSPLKMFQPSEAGQNGKVKFVRLKNDPVVERWFAIKRPLPQREKSALQCYENNLNIALKIGNHPNFMKVHGIVIKQKGHTEKPYLILEFIEGVTLANVKDLSPKDQLYLLSQLKTALTHILEIGIMPRDCNSSNFLITKEKILKMIDFDSWRSTSNSPEYATQELYGIASRVAHKLTGKPYSHSPPFVHSCTTLKASFERSVDNLITYWTSTPEESPDDDRSLLINT